MAFVGFFSACQDNSEISYEEDVLPLIEEDTTPSFSRGSCNFIDYGSRCIDYTGSLWTKEQIQLNCQRVGTVSLNACPYSDVGGCRSGAGTIAEVMIWGYSTGGQPLTGEVLEMTIGACNLVTGSSWVDKPEDLLQK